MRRLHSAIRVFAVAGALAPRVVVAGEPLAPLEFFVGQWQIEGDTTVEGRPTHWRAPYVVTREGGWLVGTAEILGAQVHDFWGWDAANKEFVRVQLLSDGTRGEIRSAGWRGDTLAWSGEASGSDGRRVKIRTAQTRTGSDSFRVEWAQLDGSAWKTYSRETLTRGSHDHGRHGNPDDLADYVAKMEDPARDAWQKPSDVVRALALKPGQTVCDIGTGPGYFALRLAKAGARVFAVDVEPKMIEILRQRVDQSRATAHASVTPVLGLPGDPLLPDGACDVALIVDTFHHFPDGAAYLKTLGRALAPHGRIVNIDFHKRELPVGPPLAHKIAREDFLRVAEQAGLTLEREETFLPHQYFLILKPR